MRPLQKPFACRGRIYAAHRFIERPSHTFIPWGARFNSPADLSNVCPHLPPYLFKKRASCVGPSQKVSGSLDSVGKTACTGGTLYSLPDSDCSPQLFTLQMDLYPHIVGFLSGNLPLMTPLYF